MNCPNCQSKMDREATLDESFGHSAAYPITLTAPASLYVCTECGTEAKWSKRDGFKLTYDSKTQQSFYAEDVPDDEEMGITSRAFWYPEDEEDNY